MKSQPIKIMECSQSLGSFTALNAYIKKEEVYEIK